MYKFTGFTESANNALNYAVELKYCPHGRPICITLSKKMLEKQFKRT